MTAGAHARAMEGAGYAHAAYLHLKIAGVIDSLAALLGAVARTAPERLSAGSRADLPAIAPQAEPTIAFLRGYDPQYRIRRLRLLARRLADLESSGDEASLAPARDAIYAALARYLECGRAAAHDGLRPLLRGRPDWNALIPALFASLDLTGLDADTDAMFADALAASPAPARQALLLAWLGFPWFDLATLPLLQGEGLDEFDAIKVDRIAPDDATSIRSGGAEATLKGMQFNSFSAFVSRAYRENATCGAACMGRSAWSTLPSRPRPGG